jgi:LacI family gluconate utilization system Gnt-I transcriptional repressor
MGKTERGRRRHKGVGRVTLGDVAKHAGVAPITVSRVMNNPDQVSEKLRKRVEQAVDALGYVPNLIAGGLASAGTRVIPVIVPSLSILTYIDVIHGIQQTLEDTGYQLLLGSTDFDLDREAALIDTVLGYSPSGIIIAGLRHRERAIQRLEACQRPVVEIMEYGASCIDSNVGVDNAEVGRCMARHLVERGYRRIAYVGSRMDRDYRTIQRYEGHREVLELAGIDGSRLLQNDEAASYKTGGRLFMEAMASYPDLDAIHFTNDNLAAGAILEANRRGIRVPDDIAVAGYLGLPLSECLTPALTTVSVPRFEMGVQAAKFLLARLDGEQGEALRCDIGFELIVRDST